MTRTDNKSGKPLQRVAVFQQNGSGERKIAGVREYGADIIALEVISIDEPLPPVLDDARIYLPATIEADLVLDFFRHQDLSHDLVSMCVELGIPVVSSGKKRSGRQVLIPPT
jgi:thymidylate synthase